MSRQMILPGLPSAIFSRASEPGHMPCVMPDGRTTALSGRGVAPVSRSAPQARERALPTSAIYGPSSSVLSMSAVLAWSLANRLRQKTALHGSTLYRLTWKERVTPSGRSIPALRASALRTSDRGFTGWPTPMGNNSTGVGSQKREGGLNLQTAAELSGWPTPRARDFHAEGKGKYSPSLSKLVGTLVGWLNPAGGAGRLAGCNGGTLPTNGFWRDADWLLCRDGRWRPVEPGTFPLAHGAAGRVGRLRGYGNAIVAPQAEAFIRAFDELMGNRHG